MTEPEDLTGVVRLFPDYASSTLWFADQIPLEYVDAEITSGLAGRLDRWEESYYAGLDPMVHDWYSEDLEREFEAEGRKLAQALAEELGREFRVQLITGQKQMFHSTAPAKNPKAAAAFRAFQRDAEERDRERERFREHLQAEGSSFGWTIYAPLKPVDPPEA